MRWKAIVSTVVLSIALFAGLSGAADKTVTVKGYVLDSACAFTKDLAKPISEKCALACANAGSPLVILADDGTIYWPIAGTTPSSGQNPKLLAYAAQKVTVTGKVYERGGSKAIVIDKIEVQATAK
jgi:type 1 fimbria pilin